MQTRNRVFDDLARVASGAASSVTGLKTEIEGMIRTQVERLMGDRGMVSREEFEVVQAMAAKARTEQEKLTKRLEALEARLGTTGKAGKAAPKAKSASTRAAKGKSDS